MNKAILHSMTESEWMLVEETERAAMADLSEDDLLELHTRIRRARSKYVKNYRRAASAKVGSAGGRGKGFAQNSRDRGNAEVFERALARVSRQVAVRASQAAAELKSERLEAVRRSKATAPDLALPDDGGGGSGRSASKTSPNYPVNDHGSVIIYPRPRRIRCGRGAVGAAGVAARDHTNATPWRGARFSPAGSTGGLALQRAH